MFKLHDLNKKFMGELVDKHMHVPDWVVMNPINFAPICASCSFFIIYVLDEKGSWFEPDIAIRDLEDIYGHTMCVLHLLLLVHLNVLLTVLFERIVNLADEIRGTAVLCLIIKHMPGSFTGTSLKQGRMA
eukprot:m51a1_g3492 hypothetical protein (130) ;mRNA; f:798565-801462